MNEGILFDLDGTLWDSAAEVLASWNQSLKRHGVGKVIAKEEMEAQMGRVLEDIFASFFPQAAPECRRQLLEHCSREELEHMRRRGGRLYPGLGGVLEDLSAAGYRLFIVSNCQKGYIEAFLEFSGLGACFADWAWAGGPGGSKAENIRLLTERQGLKKALYVGDTAWDQEAAGQAGIPFIHAAYGYGSVGEGFTPAIGSLAELPAAVAKVFKAWPEGCYDDRTFSGGIL